MEPITIGLLAAAVGGIAYAAKGRKAKAAAAETEKSIQARVVAAIATGNPDTLDAVAKELLSEGPEAAKAAVSLSALAAQWRKDAAAQQAAIDAMRKAGVDVQPQGKDPTKLDPVPVPGKVDPSERVRQLATALAAHLQGKTAGKENRKMVAEFQGAANAAKWVPTLKVDGLYGAAARDALQYYIGQPAPAPLYGAAKGQAYKPASMSQGGKVDDRYLLAQAAAGAVRGKTKATYPASTVAAVKQFQSVAGLPADGKWGKNTQAAAVHFGAKDAPAPIF